MITESTRNDFCEFVYDSLSNEPDNYLANQIIDEFDNATKNCVEWTKASDNPNSYLEVIADNTSDSPIVHYRYESNKESKEDKVAILSSILQHLFLEEEFNSDDLINEALQIAKRSVGIVDYKE
nr:MAG TPA: hypothetical protein [Caudoviricetes sp.]